ncbi:MAG: LuxR family two component transcriptional regulator [Chloroflexi bacterium OLB15]|nr:MAG: LuxR family two component transcriptional regulator [Chloroflexi bacterium OLB15]
MTETPIRLLIVDDHTLFREGLLAIFLAVSDIEVVGEASGGEEAVEKAQQLTPHVILMDIQMGEMNGIVAAARILERMPVTKIIMLTMIEDSESLFAAMMAGARGYVLKGADKSEVLRTIRAVASGDVLFGAAIANRVTDYFRNLSRVQSLQPVALPFPELSEREVEVLDRIARGLNNHEIALQLNITVKTVSNHISNIFSKLQVADRAQAIIRAREAGLGKGDQP